MDENVDVTNCEGKNDCQDGEPCLSHCLWQDLSCRIHDFLSDISLAQIVNRRDVKAVAERQDQLQGQLRDQLVVTGEAPEPL